MFVVHSILWIPCPLADGSQETTQCCRSPRRCPAADVRVGNGYDLLTVLEKKVGAPNHAQEQRTIRLAGILAHGGELGAERFGGQLGFETPDLLLSQTCKLAMPLIASALHAKTACCRR